MKKKNMRLFSTTAVLLMSVGTFGGVATGLAEELGEAQEDVEVVEDEVVEDEVEVEEDTVVEEQVEEPEVEGNIGVYVAANTTEDVWGSEDQDGRGAYRIFYKNKDNVAGTDESTDEHELAVGTHRINIASKFPTPEGSKGFIIVGGDGEVGATYFDIVVEKDKVTEYSITVDLWENYYDEGNGEDPVDPPVDDEAGVEEPGEGDGEEESQEVTVEIQHIGLKYAEDDVHHEGEPVRVVLDKEKVTGKLGETFTYSTKEFEGYTPKEVSGVEHEVAFKDYQDGVLEVLYEEERGWVKVGNTWYYMNSNGAMQTGWTKVGSTWYYLNSSGAMQTGWTKVGNTWYYMNSSGAMQTGWTKVGSTWYYLNSSGAMQTGWTKVGNTWYYMNNSGAMQTGWTKVGNTWYYMSGSGAMQTGWTKVGSTWYYMTSSGAMQTGWTKVGNTWYYMSGSGAMQTGWVKLGTRWYYMNNSGAMQIGQINVGGILYYFNSSGVLEKELGDAPSGLPSGAKRVSEDGVGGYDYSISRNLPNGGTVTKLVVDTTLKSVTFLGVDNAGNYYEAQVGRNIEYIKYIGDYPTLSDEDHSFLIDLGGQFLSAYGL